MSDTNTNMTRRLHKSVKSKEVEEKGEIEVVMVEDATESPAQTPSRDLAYPGDDDDALSPPPVLSAEEERQLWRKVDWRIMRIIMAIIIIERVTERTTRGAVSRLTEVDDMRAGCRRGKARSNGESAF